MLKKMKMIRAIHGFISRILLEFGKVYENKNPEKVNSV